MNTPDAGEAAPPRDESALASALAALRAEHAALLLNYSGIASEVATLRRVFADLIEDLSKQGAHISALAEDISTQCDDSRADASIEPMAIGTSRADLIAHRARRIAELSSQTLGYLSHLSNAAGYDAGRRREHAQRYIDREQTP
jgi:hypothetical protein